MDYQCYVHGYPRIDISADSITSAALDYIEQLSKIHPEMVFYWRHNNYILNVRFGEKTIPVRCAKTGDKLLSRSHSIDQTNR